MDVNNFYLLLELAIDPPEEDESIIEKAIKKKQAEWSRLRNHPTKGTHAQQCIGLLPEIRKVMTDPDLRRKEADAALKIIQKKQKGAFVLLDRNLAMLMSKGTISEGEIKAIAQLHGISPDVVHERINQRGAVFKANALADRLVHSAKTDQAHLEKMAKTISIDPKRLAEWVQKKQEEQQTELRYYLAKCHRRGYITQKEILRLTHLYGLSQEAIAKQIRFTIKRDEDSSRTAPNR